MLNAVPGRNSPVLNFSDRLPNPLTDRFTTVNGKQPEIFLFAPPYYHSSFFCSNQPYPRSTSSPGLSLKKKSDRRGKTLGTRLTQGLLFRPSPIFLSGKIKDGGRGNTYTERQLPPTLKICLHCRLAAK